MSRGIYNLSYGDSQRDIAFIYHYTQPRVEFDRISLLEMPMYIGFGKNLEFTISKMTIEKLLREQEQEKLLNLQL